MAFTLVLEIDDTDLPALEDKTDRQAAAYSYSREAQLKEQAIEAINSFIEEDFDQWAEEQKDALRDDMFDHRFHARRDGDE